jgi:hypothetical protein
LVRVVVDLLLTLQLQVHLAAEEVHGLSQFYLCLLVQHLQISV